MSDEYTIASIGAGAAVIAAVIGPYLSARLAKKEKPEGTKDASVTVGRDIGSGAMVNTGDGWTMVNAGPGATVNIQNAPTNTYEAYHQGRQFGEEERRKVAEENEKLKKTLAEMQGKGGSAEADALLKALQEAQAAGDEKNALAYALKYEALTQKSGAEAKATTARILFTQYRFAEAIQKMQEAAALDPENPFYQGQLLNYAGTNRDYATGRAAGEKALAAYRKLAEENPDAYEPNLATVLNNLGNLLLDENRREEALKAYEEALAIYQKLAKDNQAAYEPDSATTLYNLALLHEIAGDKPQALAAITEAMNLFTTCAQTISPAYHQKADMARQLKARIEALP